MARYYFLFSTKKKKKIQFDIEFRSIQFLFIPISQSLNLKENF